MPRLITANQYGDSESFDSSVVLACFGAVFILMGLSMVVSEGGLLSGGNDYFAYAPLAPLAFGLLLTGGGIHQAKISRRFGEPDASVAEDVIRRGETFHFLFQQQCRRRVEFNSIDLFFVFREKVDYYDGESQTKYVDRIIERFAREGRIFAPGECIREEAAFHVPAHSMGIRNPFMERRDAKVQTMWVVKVRFGMPDGSFIWREYAVEISDKVAENHLSKQQSADCYDVLFTGTSLFANPLRVTQVMSVLRPHLHDGQIGDLYYAPPCLLLERVTEQEAQTAKELFEAVNAKVELHPSAEQTL